MFSVGSGSTLSSTGFGESPGLDSVPGHVPKLEACTGSEANWPQTNSDEWEVKLTQSMAAMYL